MDSLPLCVVPKGTDPRLRPFLAARSRDGMEMELARLLDSATLLIARVVRHRSRQATDPEVEDTVSEARAQVLVSLHRLRQDRDFSSTIGDFEAYTCAVAAKTCAEINRQRDPERTKVVNRLLYLLQKRTTQHGFAFWTTADGESWAGFENWRGLSTEARSEARCFQLLANPRAAATEIFGVGGWSSLNLPDLVAALFSWLGGPLKFSDLAGAVVRLQDAPVSLVVLDKDPAAHETTKSDPVDPGSSPCDDLCWKEYLAWLWQQSAQLALPQRSAFLLHSHCLHELEFAGLTSVRQAASALGLAAERMAELWNALPLDDLAIGAILGVGRQQVINWRKAARIQLGRAWDQWSNGQ